MKEMIRIGNIVRWFGSNEILEILINNKKVWEYAYSFFWGVNTIFAEYMH